MEYGWVTGYPLNCYDYQSTCGAKNSIVLCTIYLFPDERVDLETFPPVCLPTEDFNPEGSVGHVYGEENTLS